MKRDLRDYFVILNNPNAESFSEAFVCIGKPNHGALNGLSMHLVHVERLTEAEERIAQLEAELEYQKLSDNVSDELSMVPSLVEESRRYEKCLEFLQQELVYIRSNGAAYDHLIDAIEEALEKNKGQTHD